MIKIQVTYDNDEPIEFTAHSLDDLRRKFAELNEERAKAFWSTLKELRNSRQDRPTTDADL